MYIRSHSIMKHIKVLCIKDYTNKFTKDCIYNAILQTYDDCILLWVYRNGDLDGERFLVNKGDYNITSWKDYRIYFYDINKFERKQKLEKLIKMSNV